MGSFDDRDLDYDEGEISDEGEIDHRHRFTTTSEDDEGGANSSSRHYGDLEGAGQGAAASPDTALTVLLVKLPQSPPVAALPTVKKTIFLNSWLRRSRTSRDPLSTPALQN